MTKKVKQQIKALILKETNSSGIVHLKRLEQDINNYAKSLNKEIQHTRSYQFLVNVVMAAEAYELNYHANIISKESEIIKVQNSIKNIEKLLAQV